LTAHCVETANAPPLTETSHCQAYDDVPVVGIPAVTDRGWSASSLVALAAGVKGGVSAGFTVTDTATERAVAVGDAPLAAPVSVKTT